MKTLLLSFKSRESTYFYSKLLKQHNIPHSIINTPSRISSSCSLSIKIDIKFFEPIIVILQKNPSSSLIGLFLYQKFGSNDQFSKIF